ncbi:MAG: DUF4230 domain-containing protein [Oscillospiraceae bacterium]|nr:DUF4230 domain-containing protein [Oscillospiraceae bacterium]
MKYTEPELDERKENPARITRLIVFLAGVIVLLVVGLIIMYSIMQNNVETAYQNGLDEVDRVEYVEVPVEREVIVPKEVHKEISAEIIQDGLKNIGELVTQEYNYTEVGTFESSQVTSLFGYNVTLPGTKSSYIYSYDGIIKAGIDFTQVAIEKDNDTKTITVTLPRSKITSHEFVDGSFELYDEKTSIFNPISIRDFDLSNSQLKVSAERKAIRKGLLTNANSNAESMIRSFLQSGYDLGDYTVEINWK